MKFQIGDKVLITNDESGDLPACALGSEGTILAYDTVDSTPGNEYYSVRIHSSPRITVTIPVSEHEMEKVEEPGWIPMSNMDFQIRTSDGWMNTTTGYALIHARRHGPDSVRCRPFRDRWKLD